MIERRSGRGGGRRRYLAEEKRRLVAATLEPGASVAAVARQHGLNTNMLFNWRREARRAAADAVPTSKAAGFVPLGVIGPALPATRRAGDGPGGRIEIELPNGIRLRLDASVAAPALRRVVATLKDIG